MSEPFQIVAGYPPGAVGQVVALHGAYYGREWRFAPQFECEVAAELAAFVSRLDPAREGLWLAVCGDEVGGSLAVQSEGGAARIRWFITASRLRGKGAGHALLDAALGFCRERGYGRVFLWTFAGLDAARHLYEAAGFRLVEEREDEAWGPRVVHQRFELVLTRG